MIPPDRPKWTSPRHDRNRGCPPEQLFFVWQQFSAAPRRQGRQERQESRIFWLSAKVAGGRSTPTTGCGRIAPSDAKSAKNRQGRRRCFALLFLALLAALASWRNTTVPTRQSAGLAESRKNQPQMGADARRSMPGCSFIRVHLWLTLFSVADRSLTTATRRPTSRPSLLGLLRVCLRAIAPSRSPAVRRAAHLCRCDCPRAAAPTGSGPGARSATRRPALRPPAGRGAGPGRRRR